MTFTARISACAAGLTLLVPTAATAAPKGEASGSASVSTEGADATAEGSGRAKKPKDRGDIKWIKRWAPERNMLELGIFGGVLIPSENHELFEHDFTLPNQGFQRLATVAPDVGLRFAYFPARMFGLEVEGAVMPTSVDSGDSAILWAARGHAILQLPRSVAPFILAGPSGLGVSSDRAALGNDIDLGFHFGGGVKFFLHRYVALRVDVRDTLTARQGVGDGVGHSIEVLGGLTFTFNRKKEVKKEEPGDRDGDGILDPDDKCIDVPGVPEYQGCPIPDQDKDGILDPDDKCIDVPGVPEYDGCPIPDTDKDGILDPDDKCVDEPGVPEYQGCPIPDTDGDGILDPDDKCIEEPETKNGFEDGDGCPDEVPKDVAKFTGVIEGIYFDTAKATIRKKSRPTLDAAIEVLEKYPELRLEISGHTDDKGDETYNLELSQRRADAVKEYFVGKGISTDRIETRGAGEGEPRETNATKAGRAKNRRIEFKLLQ
jgi:outer membrane protein OmpA-like peptidoglycan-associated protein